MEFRKIVQIFGTETICRAGGDIDAENGLMDTVQEGKSGMHGESRINIYTLPWVKR